MDKISSQVYEAANENCVWFHRDDLVLTNATGTEALDYLNRITTNELREFRVGSHRQTMLCTDKGRIIDQLDVLVDDNELQLLCSLHAFPQVLKHLRSYAVMDDVRFAGPVPDVQVIELTGPQTPSALRFLFDDRASIPQSGVIEVLKANSLDVRVLSVAALCEFSILLLIPTTNQTAYQEFLLHLSQYVQQGSIVELALLRIEAGQASVPAELNADHNPLEANLLHLINFKKGCYIGQEVIARLDSYNKVQRRLVGFTTTETINVGSAIEIDSVDVGQITSVAFSPRFGHIALGYIRNEHVLPSRQCIVRNADQRQTAHIQLLPFTKGKD